MGVRQQIDYNITQGDFRGENMVRSYLSGLPWRPR
ncbi:hypothetical protein DFAR_1890007 [Desulfarculales bacterium]